MNAMRGAVYSVIFGVALWILFAAIGFGVYWLAFRG